MFNICLGFHSPIKKNKNPRDPTGKSYECWRKRMTCQYLFLISLLLTFSISFVDIYLLALYWIQLLPSVYIMVAVNVTHVVDISGTRRFRRTALTWLGELLTVERSLCQPGSGCASALNCWSCSRPTRKPSAVQPSTHLATSPKQLGMWSKDKFSLFLYC